MMWGRGAKVIASEELIGSISPGRGRVHRILQHSGLGHGGFKRAECLLNKQTRNKRRIKKITRSV